MRLIFWFCGKEAQLHKGEVCAEMADASWHAKDGKGHAMLIGASSVTHLEEMMADLEKEPLPKEIVQALDVGWEGCKGVSIRYWH